LTYYGDDFTGSTDVLEALYSGGIEAVLFVSPPDSEVLHRYPHVRAFGVAGNSRAMSPQEMDVTLPNIFAALGPHNPRIVHYKVCSTFDSSTDVGSIGRAIDIGSEVFQNRLIPLAVGSPALGRYCVFGNLFAKSGLNSKPFRLDRHPTMQRHPVTPMTEADLKVHLSKQTARPIELIDVVALNSGDDAVRDKLQQIQGQGSVVLFDTLTTEHLETIGQMICEAQEGERKPLFVAGSSAIDYALVKHWQATGVAPARKDESWTTNTAPVLPVDRTIILSGSCSPVTDRQIGWALDHGFAEVPIDTMKLRNPTQAEVEIESGAKEIIALIERGLSVIAHTSRGPSDSRLTASGCTNIQAAHGEHMLGGILARILRKVLRYCSVRRVGIVGGDTSGQVARGLGIEAVEMIGPLEPGAPLCVVRSTDNTIDGLEVTFKGGQVGYDDFFGTLLSGQCKHVLLGASS
jgi:3-oxoisoapionate kinase